jgi:hypothetical protein
LSNQDNIEAFFAESFGKFNADWITGSSDYNP